MIFSLSPNEQLAIGRARTVRVCAADVFSASLESLLVHKRIAGRARNLEDAKILLLKNPNADLAYSRHWLADFSSLTNENYIGRLEQILE